MLPIQAVLFDFGKVLSLPPRPDAWANLCRLCGLTSEALNSSYWAFRDDYDAGVYTGDEYWRRVAGRDLSQEILHFLKETDVHLWTEMNAPMLEWVDALHRAGVKTGILSNMPDAMAEGICAKFDWISNFDHIVWSHALKLRKPQREIYQAAITGLGVPAESILFLDDKFENIAAAEQAGMQAILYDDHDNFVREMNRRGFASILRPAQQTSTPV